MTYQLLKYLHVTTVIISIVLFLWRCQWILRYGQHQKPNWMRWVPHVNDSLLFVLGIWLAITIQQYPFTTNWLTVKLIALLVYIFLGLSVMRWARSRQTQLLTIGAAVLVYVYMVSVAITKQPLWFI